MPHHFRPRCWRLLLRYEPSSQSRSAQTLQRKRREYQDLAPVYYDVDSGQRSEDDLADLKQVCSLLSTLSFWKYESCL